MTPIIKRTGEYTEVIGHYDDKVLCAKMTLLADLYAVEHHDGYAKFSIEDEEVLKSVDEKLEFDGDVSFDITSDTTHFNAWYATASVGAHSLKIKATDNTGAYADSNTTTLGTYNIYSVSGTGANATIEGSDSYSGKLGTNLTSSLNVSANGTSYKLPEKITVAGTEVTAGTSQTIANKCTVLFTRTSDTAGTIAFSNVTDDVSFTVTGTSPAHTINQPTLTNVTAQETYPINFPVSETKTLTFFSDANYNLPASVSVTGATSTWNVTNQYGLHGTGTNCYISPTQTQYIGTGDTFTFNLSANGTSYKLPATLSIPNATYSRTSDTAGTLTFSGVSADQNFTVVAEAIQSGYTVNVLVDGDNPGFLTCGTYVYDGTNDSGTLLGTLDTTTGQSFTVTSGNIYFRNVFASDDRFNGGTGTTGITVVDYNYWYLLASVSANGTLTIHEYQH